MSVSDLSVPTDNGVESRVSINYKLMNPLSTDDEFSHHFDAIHLQVPSCEQEMTNIICFEATFCM